MTVPTGRGPYRPGVKRKAQIVEAAWIVFARRGYSTGSLREIADHVGISRTALQRHFEAKEDLLTAVLDRWVSDMAEVSATAGAGDGLDYFLAFPELMRYHVQNPGFIELFLTLSTEASDLQHPARGWIADRYASIVADGVQHLGQACAAGQARPMTQGEIATEIRGLFAVMDGLELQWMANPDEDLSGNFDRLLASILGRWGVDPDVCDRVARGGGAADRRAIGERHDSPESIG
ncbi:TetR/AcrR family transcriptional regulator [Microbacteriaceae bacterium VKM Ac-2855]|nr:TetR/AcrR family transcriptional regulator [Microbacteriaceae bacterium VKM Ac-2855]